MIWFILWALSGILSSLWFSHIEADVKVADVPFIILVGIIFGPISIIIGLCYFTGDKVIIKKRGK